MDVAREEGRLDEAEYSGRVDSLVTATTRGDLVRMTADLPERKGVREWADGLRVRGVDREDARRWLDETAARGRLSDQEYQQRLVALSTVATYDAVADGAVKPVEAHGLEAAIRRAHRRRDIDLLLASLAERTSDRERQHTVDALTAAHQAGQLDATEYTVRAGRAQKAATDSDLAPLMADLRWRLSESNRQAVADQLKRAFDEGRLNLAEFDERVAAAHAATTEADVAPLVADLAAPPRPKRRGWSDDWFDLVVANSALITAPRHQILKVVGKTYLVAVALVYAYFLVRHTIVAVTVLWLAAIAMLAAGRALRLFAGPVAKREKAALDGLRVDLLRRLRRKHGEIKTITVEYPAVKTYHENGQWKAALRPGGAQLDSAQSRMV
ncbi:hypothetical protein JOF56_009428 [Kibdelosporangium banguiense]|uniref:DUF1707 domain-containing protein n=1 Tax=Kibdelosporangium banguiense TaxID=1365924 RepID=A0ABS4TXA5_9PSEU|nr:DUF1707 domain-containing protein [Kibdelosporangium banguiense]MBP2329043.1 hypothetical protein [Kibdelosporangium banguiense]